MSQPVRYTQDMIDEYVDKGLWVDHRPEELFDRWAERVPQYEAFVDDKIRLTWSQLKEKSDRLAQALIDLGLGKDEFIVTQLPNWVDLVVLRVAFLKAGILSGAAPMTLRHAEMERSLQALSAVGVAITPKFRNFDYLDMIRVLRPKLPSLRHIFIAGDEISKWTMNISGLLENSPVPHGRSLPGRGFSAFEVMAVLFTSGTTGAPKFSERTAVGARTSAMDLMLKGKVTREDVIGVFCPMSGGPGWMALWLGAETGAKSVLLDTFEAEKAFELIEKERVTYVSTIPTLLVRMATSPHREKYDISSLRAIRTGTAALAPSVAREAEDKLHCYVIPAGGSVEASFASTAVDDPPDMRHYTVGKVAFGNEIRIVDDDGRPVAVGGVGELWVRGAASSAGYYGDVGSTIQAWGQLGRDGWFHTGDLARLDEQGNLSMVGRKKNIIIRGGQNIYPQEIEAALLNHPSISEVALIGMPDPVMGERACAYVVVKPGKAITFEDIVAFLKKKEIALYKLPERLEVVERLPMLVDGQKVDRRALAQDITRKLAIEGKLAV